MTWKTSYTKPLPTWHLILQESYNTPLEHTPGNPPSQLWKEFLYSFIALFKGLVRGVFQRCVETTLEIWHIIWYHDYHDLFLICFLFGDLAQPGRGKLLVRFGQGICWTVRLQCLLIEIGCCNAMPFCCTAVNTTPSSSHNSCNILWLHSLSCNLL